MHSIKQALKEALAYIEKIQLGDPSVIGIPTGFKGYDDITAGLHRGEMTILAARPSMGKTALALNIAEQVAEKYGVLFVSLEMSCMQLVTRMLSSRSGVDSQAIRHGLVAGDGLVKLASAVEGSMMLKLAIDDTTSMTVSGLSEKIGVMKKKPDVLIVDYLQLMAGDKRDSREREIADISKGLKTIAKERNIAVVALSQLSRALEQRIDKRPVLSDLRESGSIEQDADVVVFLHRQDYYDDNQCNGTAELIVRKNRNGPVGTAELRFIPSRTKFVEGKNGQRENHN